jgi:hypothetical protein
MVRPASASPSSQVSSPPTSGEGGTATRVNEAKPANPSGRVSANVFGLDPYSRRASASHWRPWIGGWRSPQTSGNFVRVGTEGIVFRCTTRTGQLARQSEDRSPAEATYSDPAGRAMDHCIFKNRLVFTKTDGNQFCWFIKNWSVKFIF